MITGRGCDRELNDEASPVQIERRSGTRSKKLNEEAAPVQKGMIMNTIKVFLASSIKEFSKERQTLMAFFQTLNNIYHERGVFLEMIICESLSHQMQNVRAQEMYNRAILESEYFYVIIGNQAGEYTIEEFNIAYHSFREKGLPRIYTFFQASGDGAARSAASVNQPDGAGQSAANVDQFGDVSKSVTGFKHYISKDLQHYYNTFTHVDTIKLNMMVELCRDPRVKAVMTFEDGKAIINGHALLSMENIPLYSRNETVRKLVEEKQELEQEFADLAGLGSSAAVERLRQKNIERRSSVAHQLHELEMDILDLCKQTETNRAMGSKLNWRETKAMELVDAGDYEAAKAILRDDQWKLEVQNAKQIISGAEEIISEYISGKKSLICTIKATGVNPESEQEILSIYEDICELAAKYRIELDVIFAYAKFLWRQNHYKEAVSTCEKLILLLQVSGGSDEFVARSKSLLGVIYSTENESSKAEPLFKEALTAFQSLEEKGQGSFREEYASLYNYLAILLEKQKKLKDAEEMHRKALQIRREMAAEDPFGNEAVLASSCNNLAVVLIYRKKYDEAEALLKEALELRRKLSETNPAIFKALMANTCRNLGNLMKNRNMLQEAERYYLEALNILAELKAANPGAYELDYAKASMRLIKLYRRCKWFDDAERWCAESEEILSRWGELNFEVYGRYLGDLYHQWAEICMVSKQYEKAERLFEKALSIFTRLNEIKRRLNE